MDTSMRLSEVFSLSGFIKFGGVGAFVTISSMISSFFWLKIIRTPLYLTYFLNYSFFILVSYSLNRWFTFKAKFGFKSLIMYYLVYLFGMLLGIFLLFVFKQLVSLENWMYAFMVVPFTMTANYILSALVFHNKGGNA